MPSLTHETPLELIRQHPGLALDVLRELADQQAVDLDVPDGVTVRLAATDMSAVVPTQFLTDSVVVALDDLTGKPVLCIVPAHLPSPLHQGRDPETKMYSWPVYLTVARSINKCDTLLVVICIDPDEADACRQTITTGHPGFDLTPIVVDSGNSRPRTDGHLRAGPYLILFAGCMGGIDLDTDAGQDLVLDAARQVPASRRQSCVTLILAAASEAARNALEEKMATIAYRNDFIESFYERGQVEGRVEGRVEGFEEGETVGKAEARRDDIFRD
jgi:hypothetical protein